MPSIIRFCQLLLISDKIKNLKKAEVFQALKTDLGNVMMSLKLTSDSSDYDSRLTSHPDNPQKIAIWCSMLLLVLLLLLLLNF